MCIGIFPFKPRLIRSSSLPNLLESYGPKADSPIWLGGAAGPTTARVKPLPTWSFRSPERNLELSGERRLRFGVRR
jgi:hypothetical protein